MNENNYVDTIVKIDKVQYSLYELKRKYDERKDIILNPNFQRGEAWKTDKQKSELIESVLMGVPIPLFYFFETKSGVMEVVDGRQRITTFIDFFNNKFPLTYLPYLSNLNTKYFKDLEPRLQAKIEDYQIMINIIQPPTPERMKFDIFNRINRGGTELNHQEMRNALYQGHATKLLKELSEEDIFQKATDNKLDTMTMTDKEWILRVFYIYLLKIKHWKFSYLYDINQCLDETMKYLNKFDNYEDLDDLKSDFIMTMRFFYQMFGVDGFKFSKNEELNINLFETLVYLYMILDENSQENLKIRIEDLKDDFKEMDDFFSLDLKENQFRFEMVEDLKDNDD
jgi:predicted transcriptional regulator